MFSKIYNPSLDDFDAIVAAARPRTLIATAFLSATAIRLDFGTVAPMPLPPASLPAHIKPPKPR